MKDFSLRRDFRKIRWKETLLLNFVRSVFAGVAWMVILFIMSVQMGGRAPDLAPWQALIFPLSYLTFFLPLGLVCMFLGEIGVPLIGLMTFVTASCVAVGDPLVFVLHKMIPGLVPVKNFGLLNFRLIIFVVADATEAKKNIETIEEESSEFDVSQPPETHFSAEEDLDADIDDEATSNSIADTDSLTVDNIHADLSSSEIDKKECPACHTLNDNMYSYCSKCGTPLPEGPERSLLSEIAVRKQSHLPTEGSFRRPVATEEKPADTIPRLSIQKKIVPVAVLAAVAIITLAIVYNLGGGREKPETPVTYSDRHPVDTKPLSERQNSSIPSLGSKPPIGEASTERPASVVLEERQPATESTHLQTLNIQEPQTPTPSEPAPPNTPEPIPLKTQIERALVESGFTGLSINEQGLGVVRIVGDDQYAAKSETIRDIVSGIDGVKEVQVALKAPQAKFVRKTRQSQPQASRNIVEAPSPQKESGGSFEPPKRDW